MLKKLYKYEWKSVSLLLLILHGVLLLYTLIGRIAITFAMNLDYGHSASLFTNNIINIGGFLYLLAYAFFIIGIFIATIVYLTARIQKSMFSDEGYLTHTLPVSPAKLLWSKILIFWTWLAIDTICLILSVFLLITYKETWPGIQEAFRNFGYMFSYAGNSHGIAITVLSILTLFIQGFLYFTMLVVFSLCLGSQFKTHKILGAIVTFFGINIVQSILNAILVLCVPGLSPISTMVTTEKGVVVSSSGGNGYAAMIFTLVWYFILSVLFFLGSRYILSRKLNLE